VIQEFKDFLFRGNIIELAVAFVMGVAFAAVVKVGSR
jgi:large-conductance mechanosensitive channel